METQKIRAILMAAEKKSLSAAAEEFSYTPSALSHMADSLEEELGIKILERTRIGVELSDAGKQLKDKLSAVITAENELKRAAAEINRRTECELRIASYSSISTYLLPEILQSFKQKHPEIRVYISVDDYLGDMLKNGEADVVFGETSILGEEKTIILMEDEYVAILPEGTFARRKSVDRDELYDLTFIQTNEKILKKYFDENRFAETVHLVSVDNSSVISMVKKRLGFAVLPSLSINKGTKGVKTLKLTPKLSRTLGIAYREGSSAAKKFIDFIMKDHIKER
jgi:DNA-binding transcriptional LysR family regulator